MDSVMWRQRSVDDVEDMARRQQWREQPRLGAGQPSLGTEIDKCGQQLDTAARVEMGSHLVQQENGQIAVAAQTQPGLRQHDANKVGLLPAGGAARRGLAVQAVDSDKVAAVRSDGGSTGYGVVVATGGQRVEQTMLDLHRGLG